MLSPGKTLASAKLRSLLFVRRRPFRLYLASPSSSPSARPRFSERILALRDVAVTGSASPLEWVEGSVSESVGGSPWASVRPLVEASEFATGSDQALKSAAQIAALT